MLSAGGVFDPGSRNAFMGTLHGWWTEEYVIDIFSCREPFLHSQAPHCMHRDLIPAGTRAPSLRKCPWPPVAAPRAAGPAAPPLCPELRLAVDDGVWSRWQDGHPGDDVRPVPPYWSVAWPGGQALARYLLDHPEAAAGRTVLDCGTGSGIAAIAAALAGARHVIAIDRDPRAIAALAANAALNNVGNRIETICAEMSGVSFAGADLVLAGDLWYERFTASKVTAALRRAARDDSDVMIGDTTRAYTPRSGLSILARYRLPTDPRTELNIWTNAFVARLYAEP